MRSSATAEDPEAGPSLAGLAACLAVLELEAKALGAPLAAGLIAAAGEALREAPRAPRLGGPSDRGEDQR
jgi:hypothetical protein